MIFARFARSVFLGMSFFVTQAALAQQLVAVTSSDSNSLGAAPAKPESSPKPAPQASTQHKLGPLDLTVNWRFRTEAWDWFQPPTAAQNAYPLEHSLLRIGLGQKSE